MKKFAVMLYPDFSLQEITCLTSALTVWFGETIDFIASEDREYRSEDGLRVLPTKTTDGVKVTDAERRDVVGNIFANLTIPSGGCFYQPAVFIAEFDG